MFCSRHSNNLQSKFLVSAQTICSILATHLIDKLSASLLSLRQTGFLLPSWWPPSTGMTFHPHFRHWSRCLYILHTWILKNKYCPPPTLLFPISPPSSHSCIIVWRNFIVLLLGTRVRPCVFNMWTKTIKVPLKGMEISAWGNKNNFIGAERLQEEMLNVSDCCFLCTNCFSFLFLFFPLIKTEQLSKILLL